MSSQIAGNYHVLVAGPVSPPVNGMILVTRAVLKDFQAHYPTAIHDTAPGQVYHYFRLAGRLAKLWRFLVLWVKLPWLRAQGCRVVYMPLDSGLGLALDLITLLCVRLLGQQAVLHHHVVNYLEEHSAMMAAVNRLTTHRDLQVFNGHSSVAKFSALYPNRSSLLAVSNAVFIDLDIKAEPSPPRDDRTLRLGHMSVLTVEKGILSVFQLLGTLLDRGVDVSLVIAGPAYQQAAAEGLARAQERFGDRIDYRGPVADETKQRFFDDIDVFVFPTAYKKESEPLVLVESLASGVPVISYRRGCIEEIVGDDGGRLVDVDGDFVEEATALCTLYAKDPDALARAKEAALAQSRARFAEALIARDELIRRCGPDAV